MSNKERISQLVNKLMTGSITKSELQELNEWYDTFEEAPLELPGKREDLQDRIYQRLQKDLHKPRVAKAKKDQWKYYMGVAASLLLMGVMAYGFMTYLNLKEGEQPEVTYLTTENPSGRFTNVKLPDGSKVRLYAESSLRYPEQFTGNTREVWLNGKAYFEVSPDTNKAFIVHSQGFYTKVLGTSFNVKSGKKIEVSLVEGRVEVGNNNLQTTGDAVVLAPGEKAVCQPKTVKISKQKLDYWSDVAWKDGVLYFENATYEEVKERLESWYGVKITESNTRSVQWNYQGKFKKASLERVLERIAYAENIEFKIEGKSVVITFKHK
ncbi:FecR domain-containing protein [Rapidithrix thailandica]|uniref:FecR domain-containing protein n=1 Tax=Rapidithrix thailandica TaxID=413964 RepID=A0AAW9SAF6_9BACT